MAKTVLITGATAGFGLAAAKRFGMEGWNLVITGRRGDRLAQLRKDLEKQYLIRVIDLCFDIRELYEVEQALASLPDEMVIDVLVNNAGLASGFDTIQDGEIDDWEVMIDTNFKGLLYISRHILPGMINAGTGHVINIGSTAGKEVYLKGNVYCATKYAVDAITKGMRIDLLGTGVKVTQIAPGAADTEFSEVRFHGDKNRVKDVYSGFRPMDAEDIAELIYYVTTLPPHLCINDLVVTSIHQAGSNHIHRTV